MAKTTRYSYLYGWLKGRVRALATLNDISDVDKLKDELIQVLKDADDMERHGTPEVSNVPRR